MTRRAVEHESRWRWILDTLLRWARWDPGRYDTRLLAPYRWWSVRVTGNSQHALNGIAVWLLIGGPWWLPLEVWWIAPWGFYAAREWPYSTPDNRADVVWVLAVGIALIAPWWLLLAWMAVVAYAQWEVWSLPAPEWMPRGSLLWGRGP